MLEGAVRRHLFSTVVAAAMVLNHAAFAGVADFYRGKTLTLVISTTTGTSYDLMGRTLARYLPKYIPGNPSIIVENMPGAGGLTAANYLYRVAPKDGTVLAGLQGTLPFDPLLGITQAQFDSTKFNWLGSPSAEVCLQIVRAEAHADSIATLKARDVLVGASGNASQPAYLARLLNQVLGTRFKTVLGYPGQNDVFLAMDRGEVDGHTCVYYSALVATRPGWLKNNKVKILLQSGPEKEPELADVPFALDLVSNPEDKLLMKAAFAPLAIARPYALPPDVPADRVDATRQAMAAVMKDQAFINEIRALKFQIHGPRTGAQVQSLIASIYQSPPSVVSRLQKLVQP